MRMGNIMELDIKPPRVVLAFRYTVNALAIGALIALLAYVIPIVVFWAVHILIPSVVIEMAPLTVVALWVLIFVLGFMNTLLIALTKRK